MSAYPFSVFKRADRSCYSVSFKGPDGKYLRPVSTGKKSEAEATQAAFQMYRDGIPQKQDVLTVQDLSYKEIARNIKNENETEIMLNSLSGASQLKEKKKS